MASRKAPSNRIKAAVSSPKTSSLCQITNQARTKISSPQLMKTRMEIPNDFTSLFLKLKVFQWKKASLFCTNSLFGNFHISDQKYEFPKPKPLSVTEQPRNWPASIRGDQQMHEDLLRRDASRDWDDEERTEKHGYPKRRWQKEDRACQKWNFLEKPNHM